MPGLQTGQYLGAWPCLHRASPFKTYRAIINEKHSQNTYRRNQSSEENPLYKLHIFSFLNVLFLIFPRTAFLLHHLRMYTGSLLRISLIDFLSEFCLRHILHHHIPKTGRQFLNSRPRFSIILIFHILHILHYHQRDLKCDRILKHPKIQTGRLL